ncbi:uncharacterized protein UMAG_10258 [Mycosarcoma maydis]|uniref:Uncharacterized protein n=1 Tax=Mycosarcoma maydis TaxID=5270 RepID=A0A0D1E8E4_MYCMD|nr:uncharacterized protein UMAG_10258 [Ustilago maydis 521]KIS70680.1 hypothetical protein UMAG_10258 [Ustilago maydis 521]|eukprot:XP_011387955.1 hypothetical protein UMAG_10258 [Ustilago maydis 521]
MPPIPENGMCYPPSSSGYQPLDFHDDVECFDSAQRRVAQRTFAFSPYRSQANDASDLLKTFLLDTRRHDAPSKQLYLRITCGSAKYVDLPLPAMGLQDSLPFALADDVPCFRGLSGASKMSWAGRLREVGRKFIGRSASICGDQCELRTCDSAALQVWNASQRKPLYASPEEIERYHKRLRTTRLPPWTPLNDEFLPRHRSSQSSTELNPEEEVDRVFDASASVGDLDLSSVFARTRERKTSRLISSGLQEAIERFADDRHFSKHLVCNECVWGWDLALLKTRVQELVHSVEVQANGNATSRQNEELAVEIDVQVIGLDDIREYHVVWAPIAYVTKTLPTVFNSRASLLSLVMLVILFTGTAAAGILTNTLVFIGALLLLSAWSTLTWLVRTQDACIHDTIGTAWCLAPRWVKLQDADPDWDHDRAVQSLKADTDSSALQNVKRGVEDAWFVQRGLHADEWLQSQRERLVHWVKDQ